MITIDTLIPKLNSSAGFREISPPIKEKSRSLPRRNYKKYNFQIDYSSIYESDSQKKNYGYFISLLGKGDNSTQDNNLYFKQGIKPLYNLQNYLSSEDYN